MATAEVITDACRPIVKQVILDCEMPLKWYNFGFGIMAQKHVFLSLFFEAVAAKKLQFALAV
jgi:hypothetical protein